MFYAYKRAALESNMKSDTDMPLFEYFNEECAYCVVTQAITEFTHSKKYPQEPHLGVVRCSESKQAHVGFSIFILSTYTRDAWHAN